MTMTLLLRISCAVSLLFALGHSAGGLRKWSPMGDNDVLTAMTTVRFNVMGASRSYMDLYMGFGWSIAIAMILQTALLWHMSTVARTDPAAVRPMVALMALATAASGVIAWRFIFVVPALFSIALLVPLMLALIAKR
ncbi:MAG TPA: hypothetical protein VG962_13505 [Steroidobacteraceae bacterium]|nr:hypothetical protein [Steroidobacteraceae bacterium]